MRCDFYAPINVPSDGHRGKPLPVTSTSTMMMMMMMMMMIIRCKLTVTCYLSWSSRQPVQPARSCDSETSVAESMVRVSGTASVLWEDERRLGESYAERRACRYT